MHVDGLTLGNAHPDKTDQDRLNRLFTSRQDIQIAENEAKAATKEALANNNLGSSLTPSVLIQRCFDAAEVIKPAVFNCFPGGGTNAPVIVSPSGK